MLYKSFLNLYIFQTLSIEQNLCQAKKSDKIGSIFCQNRKFCHLQSTVNNFPRLLH